MHIQIFAIGDKFPDWVNKACDDYIQRFGNTCKIEVIAYPTPSRKTHDISKAKEKEANLLLKQIQPQDYVIALDERGKSLTSIDWSKALDDWQMTGHRIC